jgi:hypothetical protein
MYDSYSGVCNWISTAKRAAFQIAPFNFYSTAHIYLNTIYCLFSSNISASNVFASNVSASNVSGMLYIVSVFHPLLLAFIIRYSESSCLLYLSNNSILIVFLVPQLYLFRQGKILYIIKRSKDISVLNFFTEIHDCTEVFTDTHLTSVSTSQNCRTWSSLPVAYSNLLMRSF